MTRDEEIEKIMESLARKYFAGVFRRDGKTPAITHMEDVVRRLRSAGPLAKALGWGHDLIEDKRVTREKLINHGVPESFVQMIESLTFPSGMSVDEYHAKVAEIAPAALLRRVKLADNLSNLSEDPSDRQVKKYSGSIDILLSYECDAYSGTNAHCKTK